jgi:toxin ParE1/3/4
VATLEISGAAEDDLVEIGLYTREHWGAQKEVRYLSDLGAAFVQLVEDPRLGQPCDDIRKGLLRFRHRSHVIFFRRSPEAVQIIRVLHERMLPQFHL